MKPLSSKHLAASLMMAACAQSGLAQTAALATGQMNGLAYHLIDLDPTDGIAPSVQFSVSNGPSGAYSSFDLETRPFYAASFAYKPDVQKNAGPLFGDSPAVSLSNAEGTQTASRSGTTYATSTATSYADLNEPLAQPRPAGSLLYYASSSVGNDYISGQPSQSIQLMQWSLSPHTKLVIDGMYDMHVSSDIAQANGAAVTQYLDRSTDPTHYSVLTLSSGTNLSMWLSPDDLNMRSSSFNKSISVSSTLRNDGLPNLAGQADSSSGAFDVDMSNNGSSALTGTFLMSLSNYSSLSLTSWSTVPEPGTWMLMGLGLAGLVAVSSRKSAPKVVS
jgi:hypothetical protein